ncbi:MAG: DUF2577 domain-containing protein [Candidatus Metalachnospira sp.]|nr:DUF2577 domain-containing protein [Candidatus Metalachnospira sp.]
MDEIGKYIKMLAKDQVEAGKPAAVMLGNVTSAKPLEIQIDQKLTLTESFLILTKAVIDYSVDMTVDHLTENHTHDHSYTDDGSGRTTGSNTHCHAYKGRKKFIMHNKLKVGDKVILLRVQGGQKFIVLDVVGGGNL